MALKLEKNVGQRIKRKRSTYVLYVKVKDILPIMDMKFNATGNIVNQKLSVLDVCKAVVDRIDVAFYSDGSDKIKYRVHALGENRYDLPVRNRSEKNLFKTRKEAEAYCFKENTKEINMPT